MPSTASMTTLPSTDGCTDTSFGALDEDEYACDYYTQNPADCNGDLFDDIDFTLQVMCCACGGGTAYVAPPTPVSSTVSPGLPTSCENTNAGALDEDEYGCSYYDVNQADCALQVDDGDFTLLTMCCACGGGTSNVVATASPIASTVAPTGTPAHPPTVCTDTSFGALDEDEYGCSFYDTHQEDCGDLFDDVDFTLQVMCCACGGGTAYVAPPTSVSLTVSPVGPPTSCENTNAGALDEDEYGCSYYDVNEADCALQVDDGDFTLLTMCCACGGGTSYVMTTTSPSVMATASPTAAPAFPPTNHPTAPLSECNDTSFGALDEDEYDCSWYRTTPEDCNAIFDDIDFTVLTMCCGCGGGTNLSPGASAPPTSAPSPAPSIPCNDTSNGATDEDGYGCGFYASTPEECTRTSIDDDDFTPIEMCCGCGGGSLFVPSTAPSASPVSACGCLAGNGPCRHSTGLCVPYMTGTEQCEPGLTPCDAATTTEAPPSECNCLFGSSGPCRHVDTGFCLDYIDGTDECQAGLARCDGLTQPPTASTTTGSSSSSASTTAEDYPNCGCGNSIGPCKHPEVALCLPYGLDDEGVSTGECETGLLRCDRIENTTPATTTAAQDCGCSAGTGPCKHPQSNDCLAYISETEMCESGLLRCDSLSTSTTLAPTTTVAPTTADANACGCQHGTNGPCIHLNSRLCFAVNQLTDACDVGLVACDSITSVPSAAPASAPTDAPTVDCSVYTCGADCDGDCGWDSSADGCVLWEVTQSHEIGLGPGCPTIPPPSAELAPPEPTIFASAAGDVTFVQGVALADSPLGVQREAVLTSVVPGGSVGVSAVWGPFTATTSFNTVRLPAAHIDAGLIDAETDESAPRVRMACRLLDANFSPHVDVSGNNGRCFARLQNSGGNQDANCRVTSQHGTCVVEFQNIDIALLSAGNMTVRYGLNVSMTNTLAVQPVPHLPAAATEAANTGPALENSFVLVIPPQQIYTGDGITVAVVARAAETINGGKFAIDCSASILSGRPYLEVIPSSVRMLDSASATWTVTPSEVVNGVLTFVMVKKGADSCTECPECSPCYAPQPGGQQDQPVLTVMLRANQLPSRGTATVFDDSNTHDFGVSIRVYEFDGADLATSDRTWTFGHVIGRGGVHFNSAAVVRVMSSRNPVAAFAQLSTGHGVYMNNAVLTGQTATLAAVVYAYWPSGTRERRTTTGLSCSGVDSDGHLEHVVDVGASCLITFRPEHNHSLSEVSVAVAYLGQASVLRFRVFIPEMPLTLGSSAVNLGPLFLSAPGASIDLPLHGDADCSSRQQQMAHATVTATVAYRSGHLVTGRSDVTRLVASQMASGNPAVLSIDIATGVATGVAAGLTAVTVGSLGSVAIAVSGTPWYLNQLAVRPFRSMSASVVGTDIMGIPTVGMTLAAGQIDRTRAQGRHRLATWASFSPIDTPGAVMHVDLSRSARVSYTIGTLSVARTRLVQGSNGAVDGFVEAVSSGNTTLTANWTDVCASSVLSGSATVSVQLPDPDSAHVTNGNSDGAAQPMLLANANDAAFISTGIRTSEQRVGFALRYPSYTDHYASDDDPLTFSARPSGILVVGPCTNGAGVCLTAAAGASGVVNLTVAFAGTHTAHLAVTVVKAESIALTAMAFPAFGSSFPMNTLRPFGDPAISNTFEQAALSAVLRLSNGATSDVSNRRDDTTFASAAPAVIQVTDFNKLTVNQAITAESGVSIIRVQFPGLSGDRLAMLIATIAVSINTTVNPVTAIRSVQIAPTQQSTMYGLPGATFRTEFTAEFADGFQIARNQMYRGSFDAAFVSAMFDFASSDAQLMTTNDEGTVVIHENSLGGVSVSVSTADTSMASGTHYVNLRAGDLEMDIASSSQRLSRGEPFGDVTAATQSFNVEVYLTTNASQIGALEVELMYDRELLSFNAVSAGSDFSDTFTGEQPESRPGVVAFGGTTTNYLSGVNKHIATVTFSVNAGTAGVAAFSGLIVTAGDSSARSILQTSIPFGEAGTASATIGGGNRRTRRWDFARDRRIAERQSALESVRARRQESCTAGAGPYPIGDVNGDCLFDTIDALITSQYLLINDNGVIAIATFFRIKEEAGAIQGGLTSSAMDVDFNGLVQVVDVQSMIFIKFNHKRIVRPAEMTCNGDIAITSAVVERASGSSDFDSDPSLADKTRVVFVITGPTPASAQRPLLASQFEGPGMAVSIPLGGRFIAVAPASDTDVASGLYSFQFDQSMLPAGYGVSVIHLVLKRGTWKVGGFSTGNPRDVANRLENADENMILSLAADSSTVAFTWDSRFVPFGMSGHCVVTDTGLPTAMPSTSPTPMSSTLQPTHQPSLFPSSQQPTSAPSSSPSMAPSRQPSPLPSSTAPSLEPSGSPTRAPSEGPSDAPSAAPSNRPTRHICDGDTHGCDTTEYGICERISGDPGYQCSCVTTHQCVPDCVTANHTCEWITLPPTGNPSFAPASSPNTPAPSGSPSPLPSTAPPTSTPTDAPASGLPTASPSLVPSSAPSEGPSYAPSAAPSNRPTRHICDGDTHGCDTTEYGICERSSGDPGYQCSCVTTSPSPAVLMTPTTR